MSGRARPPSAARVARTAARGCAGCARRGTPRPRRGRPGRAPRRAPLGPDRERCGSTSSPSAPAAAHEPLEASTAICPRGTLRWRLPAPVTQSRTRRVVEQGREPGCRAEGGRARHAVVGASVEMAPCCSRPVGPRRTPEPTNPEPTSMTATGCPPVAPASSSAVVTTRMPLSVAVAHAAQPARATRWRCSDGFRAHGVSMSATRSRPSTAPPTSAPSCSAGSTCSAASSG